MEKWPIYIFGTILIMLLISCSSQKSVMDVKRKENILKGGSGTVITAEHNFKTLKVKRMNVDFIINGQKDSFRGTMAVSRDSLIAVSVIPVIGYEAIRIMFTKDSIIVINRTDKTYHASSLDYYIEKYHLPAKFDDLQAVLVNELFFYQNEYADGRYKNVIREENGRIIYNIASIKGGIEMTNQQISTDSASYKIRNMFIADYLKNIKMNIGYDDFDGTEMGPFPRSISVNVQDGRNSINIKVNYNLVIFDEPIIIKFEIPENYSRVQM